VILSVALLVGLAEEVVAISGTEYRRMQEGLKVAYVRGILDGWFQLEVIRMSSKVESRAEDDVLYGSIVRCMAGRMTGEQTRAIVDKYVAEHPAQWHEEMALLVWLAMSEACRP
jgi:hypothetical protein